MTYDVEKQPLLDSGNLEPEEHNVDTPTTVTPIGPDELPPHHNSLVGLVPLVSCRVCSTMIDILMKKDQHVVKCNSCNEATPIRNAPPGRKYVRCPCNCLLICRSSSKRIACPRPNCKRIVNLGPLPSASVNMPNVPGMCSVTCVHCHDTFLFNTLNNTLARCPHCRCISSVGQEFARARSITFLFFGLIVLGFAIGVTAGTLAIAQDHGGMYLLYTGAFLVALMLLLRSFYYCSMKISLVEGPI